MTLDPPVRPLLAPNPSPLTGAGTNTWLVGATALAAIDPGPDDPAHLAAILAAVRPGQHISHILVTHAHRDHSPLARRLSAATVGGDCQQRGLWPAAYPVGRHPPPTTVVAANHLGRLLTPVSGVYCRRIWPTGSVDSIHRRQQLGAVAARRGGKRLERLEVAQHFFWRTGIY